MGNIQLHINFESVGHIENNIESQLFLNKNLKHFSDQCETLYRYMLKGKRVNLKVAINDLDIWDLRRRIKDLKDKHGIKVQSERMPGGYKDYYL